MKIEEIDRNLKVESTVDEPDIVWMSAREEPFSLRGVFYDEAAGCFVRMTREDADRVSRDVRELRRCPSGGRIRFRTDSEFIGFRAVLDTTGHAMPQSPLAAQSGFDLYVKNRFTGKSTLCYAFEPTPGRKDGYSSHFRSDTGDVDEYTINFPVMAEVRDVFIALKKGATLEKAAPYRNEKPVVFYGSSITQGNCASLPGNAYEAIISSRMDIDYLNLGFSGCCLGEEAMAEYIAGLDMSALVMDYDHNASGAEHLLATHERFFRIIRERHPTLPVIFMTAPNILPWYTWYQARRDAIKRTYDRAVAAGDRNVYFIDGIELFGDEDADLCTVDTCHPNSLGFYRMALRVERELKKCLHL